MSHLISEAAALTWRPTYACGILKKVYMLQICDMHETMVYSPRAKWILKDLYWACLNEVTELCFQ